MDKRKDRPALRHPGPLHEPPVLLYYTKHYSTIIIDFYRTKTMTYLSVQWKGHPHHHPRIQVASSCSSAQGRIIAQIAAEQLVLRPLSPSFERVRRKQSCKAQSQAQKSRALKSAVSATSYRRRIAFRAKQNLRLCGCLSSPPEVIGRVTQHLHPSVIQLHTPVQQTPVLPYYLSFNKRTTIPSIDGAANSAARDPECVYSKKNQERSPNQLPVSNASCCSTTNRHPHFVRFSPSLSPLITWKYRVCKGSEVIRRGRTYDPRIAPIRTLEGNQDLCLRYSKSIVSRHTSRLYPPSSKSARSKRLPTKWRTLIHMGVNQNDHTPLAQDPAKSKLPFRLSTSLSRTPSEKRALRKFVKELEEHLEKARDLPKAASLVTSLSATTVSAYTITEFEPYRAQFQAAGLAVTSDEQRGMAFARSRKCKGASLSPPSQAMPTGSRYCSEKENANAASGKNPSQAPVFTHGSSGTTVMGFTPPHQRTYHHSTSPIPRRLSSADYTIIGSTPPQAAESQAVSPSPKQSTKRTLPWLRNQISTPAQPHALTGKNPAHEDDVLEDVIIPGKDTQFSSSTKTPPFQRSEETELGDQYERPIQNPSLSPGIRQDILQYVNNNAIVCKRNKRLVKGFVTKRIPERNRNKFSTPVTRNSSKVKSWGRNSPPQSPPPKCLDQRCRLAHSDSQSIYSKSPVVEYPSKGSPSPSQRRTRSGSAQTNCLASSRNEDSLYLGAAQSKPGRRSLFPLQPGIDLPPNTTNTAVGTRNSTTRECEKETNGSLATKTEVERGDKVAINVCTRECSCRGRRESIEYGPRFQEDIQLKPDLQKHHFNRKPKRHICAVESPIACPQCFPSRQTSSAGFSPESTPPNTQTEPSLGRQSETIHAQESPVADPVKRPFPPKADLSPEVTTKRISTKKRFTQPGSSAKVSTRVSNGPAARRKDEPFSNVFLSSTSLDTDSLQAGQVSDKTVFQGLHVATAAACDEDIDKWIEDLTGIRVRQFLASLSKFDSLGSNALTNVARRAARQRKGELEAWERLRESRRSDREKVALQAAMNELMGVGREAKDLASRSPAAAVSR